MLKYFRKYNKWILAVGGALLMVVFLIPQALFTPSAGDFPVGEINGEEVSNADVQGAAAEIQALQSIPVLGSAVPADPLHWLLTVHEARRLGLSASSAEVQVVLETLGVDERFLARLRQQTRIPQVLVEQAVRHWIMVQQYQSLVLGEAFTPLPIRLRAIATAQQYAQQGNILAATGLIRSVSGSQRLSEPLVQHFVADQLATVAGEAVLVDHSRFLDQVPPPSEERLVELFERYRDTLPGESEPYGFGYRRPARVQIEWLTIPAEEVRRQVQVEPAEVDEFFEQNRDRFSPPGQPAPARLTTDMYRQVRDLLREQKAQELARQIAEAARSLMLEHEATRQLPTEGGYRQLPEGFQPASLDDVAAALQERFGVNVRVNRAIDPSVPVREIANLPGVGSASLATRPQVNLERYVRSARELNPAPDNPLMPLRLQVGLPSEPLRGVQGDYYVFRLRAAAPARSPESLNEVREQVVADARQLAAYQMLIKNREQFLQTAREQGLQALAEQVNGPVLNVGPISRRRWSPQGRLTTPELPAIGRSDDLIGSLFEVARAAAEDQSLQNVPADQRIGAAGVEQRLKLAVFRVDRFEPVGRGVLEQMTARPDLGATISQVLLAERVKENPLSLENIAERVGYTGDGLEDGTD